MSIIDTLELRNYIADIRAGAVDAEEEFIAHLEVLVAKTVADERERVKAQIMHLTFERDAARQAMQSMASAPQQHAQAALSDVVKYTRLARGIQNPAGHYPNGPFEDFYACDDVLKALGSQQPAAAPWSDKNATQRLRSIVSALGMESVVPDGDLTGYEFTVLGMIRLEIERLKEKAALAAATAVQDEREQAAMWRYVRDTTTAIRDPETGEREECTPEQFEAAVRAALTKGQP